MDVNAEDKLEWADHADWERLGLDLMAQGRMLAMDWLVAGSREEKEVIKERGLRVIMRLATLEIADCREELYRRRLRGLRNDQLCISTLGRMTDALDGAHADLLAGGDGLAYTIQALTAAKALKCEGLLGWFRYGPHAGLLLVARLLLEQQSFDFSVTDDLQTLTWCAEEIPFGTEPLSAVDDGSFAAMYRGFIKAK